MDRAENIVVFRFAEEASAYQALSELQRLGGPTADVRGAMLVERQEDGTVRIPEGVDARAGEGTLVGGLVGSVVGLLGGPLGVVLGWGTGALVGGGADWRRTTEGSGLVALVADEVSAGSTVLVAEVAERDTAAIDVFAMRFGAVLERRPSRAGASRNQGGPRGGVGGGTRGREGAPGAEEGPVGSRDGGPREGAQAAVPTPGRLTRSHVITGRAQVADLGPVAVRCHLSVERNGGTDERTPPCVPSVTAGMRIRGRRRTVHGRGSGHVSASTAVARAVRNGLHQRGKRG